MKTNFPNVTAVVIRLWLVGSIHFKSSLVTEPETLCFFSHGKSTIKVSFLYDCLSSRLIIHFHIVKKNMPPVLIPKEINP